MAGAAVTFLSVTQTHVILRLRVGREIIGFLSVTDTYIHTYIHTISEMRRRISCLALRRSAIIEKKNRPLKRLSWLAPARQLYRRFLEKTGLQFGPVLAK